MKFNDNKQAQALLHHVAACMAPYRALVLAFSGGMDSTVLLDILTRLYKGNGFLSSNNIKPTLRAVHIHHSLSHHADEWAMHCAKECRRQGIAFTVIHIVVSTTSDSIEAAARNARYRALATTLTQGEVLLTAHHQDDQAETLLLALKRGSGPAGLSAMAADSLYLGCQIVRPLLDFNRKDLEEYAQIRGLHWIEDDSNTDLRFDRNFLRLRVLPLFHQRWPKFSNAVTRSAQLCAEQERLLDELLSETLENIIASDGSLCLMTLKTMSKNKRSALLRRWLGSLGIKMPARAQLTRLWQEVVLSRRDAVAQIKIDNRQIRRFRNRLYVLPQSPTPIDNKITFPWPRESNHLILSAGLGHLYRCQVDIGNVTLVKSFIATMKESSFLAGKQENSRENFILSPNYIDSAKVYSNIKYSTNTSDYINNKASLLMAIVREPFSDERVSVRFGPVRGLLYIVGRRRGRSLKKIWQELNVPPWQRNNIPLLFYNDQLVAAPGVFVTQEGVVRKALRAIAIFWESGQYQCDITPGQR